MTANGMRGSDANSPAQPNGSEQPKRHERKPKSGHGSGRTRTRPATRGGSSEWVQRQGQGRSAGTATRTGRRERRASPVPRLWCSETPRRLPHRAAKWRLLARPLCRLPAAGQLAWAIRAWAVSTDEAVPVRINGAGTGWIGVACECGGDHVFAGDWTARDVRDACHDEGGPRCPETGARLRLLSVRTIESTGSRLSSGIGPRGDYMRQWWPERWAAKEAHRRRHRQRHDSDEEEAA